MICKKCGSVVENDARYCRKCGTLQGVFNESETDTEPILYSGLDMGSDSGSDAAGADDRDSRQASNMTDMENKIDTNGLDFFLQEVLRNKFYEDITKSMTTYSGSGNGETEDQDHDDDSEFRVLNTDVSGEERFTDKPSDLAAAGSTDDISGFFNDLETTTPPQTVKQTEPKMQRFIGFSSGKFTSSNRSATGGDVFFDNSETGDDVFSDRNVTGSNTFSDKNWTGDGVFSDKSETGGDVFSDKSASSAADAERQRGAETPEHTAESSVITSSDQLKEHTESLKTFENENAQQASNPETAAAARADISGLENTENKVTKEKSQKNNRQSKKMLIILLLAVVLVFAFYVLSIFLKDDGTSEGGSGQMNLNDDFAVFASSPPGEYSAALSVSLISNVGASSIYYTLDGTEPGTNSNLYTQPIQLDYGSYTLKAAAVFENDIGNVYTFEYKINTSLFEVGTAILSTYSGSYNDAAGTPVYFTTNYSIPAVISAGANTESLAQELKSKLDTYYVQDSSFLAGDFSIMSSWGLAGWDVSYQLHSYKGNFAVSVGETLKFNTGYALETHKNYYYDSVRDAFVSGYQYADNCGIDAQSIIDSYNNSEFVKSGELQPVENLSEVQFYINEMGEIVAQFVRTVNY